MSAVLDRGGLQQRWVAVYPPGDPLNLHFDPMQLPRDGSPQVCLSVAVHEDLLATVANLPVDDHFASAASSGAFGSWRFSPELRSSDAVPASDKVDQLRRSITSLQAEMKLSQDRGDSERGVAFARESLLSVAGGSHHGPRSSPGSELMPGGDLAPWPSIAVKNKVELDSWLKEKERQAQKIKEHVEDMAKAQRRAEDVGRNLQEQLDLLAELRRRSRSTEASLVESKLQLQELERQKEGLQQEGAAIQINPGPLSKKRFQGETRSSRICGPSEMMQIGSFHVLRQSKACRETTWRHQPRVSSYKRRSSPKTLTSPSATFSNSRALCWANRPS